MNCYVLGFVLGAASISGARCLAAEQGSKVSMLTVDPVVEKIRPGMTRAEVETWLKDRDGGPQSASSTRYYRASGLIIEVSYDQTGGTWTPANRVNGPVNIRFGARSNL